jgi:hypothetical protein
VITAQRLREVLNYDPETGVLTRLVRTARRIRIGDVAGNVDTRGYLRLEIDGRQYAAHRLAWLHMTGEWPPADIDHINGERTDNRWSNLRLATRAQNIRNSRRRSTNTTGFKGVSWQSARKKWVAAITVNGIKRSLGRFDCPAEAHAAYVRAAEKYHGEFARAE